MNATIAASSAKGSRGTKVWGYEVVGYAFGAETREAMVAFFASAFHA